MFCPETDPYIYIAIYINLYHIMYCVLDYILFYSIIHTGETLYTLYMQAFLHGLRNTEIGSGHFFQTCV